MHSFHLFFRWIFVAFMSHWHLGVFATISTVCHTIPARETIAQEKFSSVDTTLEKPLKISLQDIGFPGLSKQFPHQQTPHIAGEKVIVIVKIQNSTTNPIMLVLGNNPHESVRFSVKAIKGNKFKVVPRTKFSRNFQEPSTVPQQVIYDFGGGPQMWNIKPGDSANLKFNLARRFDLSMPGEYEISAFMIPQIVENDKLESSVLKKVKASPMVIYIRERGIGGAL